MTTTPERPITRAEQRATVGVGVRLLRAGAWMLVGAGLVVALYLVYSLFFTNLQTDSAQRELRREWEGVELEAQGPVAVNVPQPDPPGVPGVPGDTEGTEGTAPVVDAPDDPVIGGDQAAKPSGESVALLWFERPGENPPVTDKTYVVVSGVTLADLAKGPGHYPQTAAPGEAGNFAVAGHRTTHGAPFFRLDELREGDEIHVVDRQGDEHVYAFREQRIVAPTNLDVLGSEPIPDAQGIITLTTCHPRFSNSQRLIVFGELQ